MQISSENRRISVADDIDIALTQGQKIVFAHWEEGFDAQARGVRFEACPEFHPRAHKIRRVWREGWLAGAAVDRMAATM